jgi:hypothetical protein
MTQSYSRFFPDPAFFVKRLPRDPQHITLEDRRKQDTMIRMIMFPRNHLRVLLCAAGLQLFVAMGAQAADAPSTRNTPAKKTEAIPWDQLGAKAGANYQGDGLSVAATEAGARLHCGVQRLDGEATGEGLWLVSTVTNRPDDRFRVVARAVGRQGLSSRGTVTVTGQTVRFAREGLVEEYSVSLDGVRQDFVVLQKPAGDGQLKVQLAVNGARVEPAAYGAHLVLEKSGRELAYRRLRATDANGKELPARLEVEPESKIEVTLAVVVNDAGAAYPVRIDPTFSDANWVSMNSGIPGIDGHVYVAVTDDSGNLYIGGQFTFANHLAKWNGSSWSPVGSGMNYVVTALAVSGGTLYAGGSFTTAGGNSANYIAQWNGSSWSPLGSGMNGNVSALAVSGGTLYASGAFTWAGGHQVNYIAQWDGSSWSALGSGMNTFVYALAVSGGTLYAGGEFWTAGGNAANYIAQWNGSSWSPLASGMNDGVFALAVSGGTLYASGAFTAAGGNAANYIAQWDGSSWSALGSGMGGGPYPYVYPYVYALAVSGGTLYAGGAFTTAGGKASAFAAEALLPDKPPFIITTNSGFGFTNGHGAFGFDVSGSPGQTQVVLGSTNLTIWAPLQTNVLNDSFWYFSDPSASNFTRRFYRAELLQ